MKVLRREKPCCETCYELHHYNNFAHLLKQLNECRFVEAVVSYTCKQISFCRQLNCDHV